MTDFTYSSQGFPWRTISKAKGFHLSIPFSNVVKIIKLKVGGRTYNAKDCSGLSAVRGLMFDPVNDYDGALIHANSIWTPFCVPLDLFFLDKNFKVLSRKRSVPMTLDPRTWKTYTDRRAAYCLEIKRN